MNIKSKCSRRRATRQKYPARLRSSALYQFRPRIEQLEDRRLLSAIFSDSFSGSYPGSWDIGHDGGDGSYAWAWPNDYAHCYSNPSGGQYYYPNDLHVYMERRGVSLSGYDSASLSFSYIVDTESGYDHFTVNVRDQSGSWHELWDKSGTTDPLSWSSKTLSLDSFAGQSNLYIQFRFDSDGSISGSPYDGVFIDNVSLTAAVQNDPPTASRQSPTNPSFSIPVGATQNFTVLCQDSDGNLDFVDWYLNGGQPQAQHNISGFSDTDSWSYTFNTVGVYTVEAMAFDDGSPRLYADPPATWTVTVIPNRAPTATRQSPTNSAFSIPINTILDFTVLGQDPDGNLARVDWYLNGGLPQAQNDMSGSSDTDNWTHYFSEAGTYIIEAQVWDNGTPRLYSDLPATWTVTVIPNRAPTASPQNPENASFSVPINTTVDFTVLGQDPDGNLRGSDWYLEGDHRHTEGMSGLGDTATWTHTFVIPGTYTVGVEVFDTEWKYSTPVAWTVNVLEPSRGMFVDYIGGSAFRSGLLNSRTSQLSLLEYARQNNITYLALYVSANHFIDDPLFDDRLSSFIELAKTSFGIEEIGLIGGSTADFDKYAVYAGSHPGYIDVLNLENEYWGSGDYTVYKSILQYMANVASTHSLRAETYLAGSVYEFTLPDESQMKEIAGIVDRLLLEVYVTDPESIVSPHPNYPSSAYDYLRQRLLWAGDSGHHVTIWPIFSVESTSEYDYRPFMGDWLRTHSLLEAENAFLDDYANDTDPRRLGVNVSGFQYFAYQYMTPLLFVTASSFYPEHNSTDVAVDANLQITFADEDGYAVNIMKGTTGHVTIERASDGAVVESIPVTDGRVTVTGSTVTINPSSDLVAGTCYSILMDPTCFDGNGGAAMGSSYPGVSIPGVWQFTTIINAAPTIASISDTPDPVTRPNEVILEAHGVDDPDSQVMSVAFYRETNGTPGLQVGGAGDTLVGTDNSSSGGWRTSFSTAGLAVGTYTYYARATDDQEATSPDRMSAPSTTNTVQNIVPTAQIDSISPNPSQPPNQIVDFRGTGNDSDGNIVAWEWVSDLDGRLSNNEDFSLSSHVLTVGSHQISFRVQDEALAWSEADVWEFTVLNALPTAEIDGVPVEAVPAGSHISIILGGYDNDENRQQIIAGELEVWLGPSLIATYAATPGPYDLDLPSVEGTYTLKYRVEDDEGIWSSPVADTVIVFETIPPEVVNWEIGNGTAQRSTIKAVQIEFSEDVFGSLVKEHLHLRNITTGEDVAAADMALITVPATLTAIWTFPNISGGKLPEGNYVATLDAAGVRDGAGNKMQENYVFEFHVFPGDATGDRRVNAFDLLKVRQNYLKPPGPDRDDSADVTGDGAVNAFDLLLVRQNYLEWLEVPFEIVVSTTDLAIEEGDSATFDVSLSRNPVLPITVTIASDNADPDLSVLQTELLFTSDNWDQPQSVMVTAAEDADSLAGNITLTLASESHALNSPVVTVTENDNDSFILARIAVPGTPGYYFDFSNDGTKAYVPAGPGVTVIDTATLEVIDRIEMSYGPKDVRISPDGTFGYASSTGSGYSATKFDTATHATLGDVSTGTDASGIVYTPDGSTVYMTNHWSSRLTIIDTASNTAIGNVDGISPGGLDLEITPDGTYIYVVGREGNIYRVSTATNTVVRTIACDFGGHGASAIKASADGQLMYIAGNQSDSLHVFSTATDTFIQEVSLGSTVRSLELSPLGHYVLVTLPETGEVKAISTYDYSIIEMFSIGGQPHSVEITPDGTRAFVGNLETEEVIVLDVTCLGLENVALGTNGAVATTDSYGSNIYQVSIGDLMVFGLSSPAPHFEGLASDGQQIVQSNTTCTTNWNAPQPVTLAAAEDVDTIDGMAEFTVSASNARNERVVAATESDNDQVLLAEGMGALPMASNVTPLMQTTLDKIADAAISRWAAVGLSDGLLRSDEQLVLTWAVADAGRVAARNLWIDDRFIAPTYGPFGNAYAGRLGSLSAGTHEYAVEVIDKSGTASREYGKFHVAAFADLAPPQPIIPIPVLDAAFQDQDGSPLLFGLEATLEEKSGKKTSSFATLADEVFGGYGE